jgi:hypothetical protein
VKFIKILLLCALSLAWADDYEEFEKSLMEEPVATVAEKQAVSDSSEKNVAENITKRNYTDEAYWA